MVSRLELLKFFIAPYKKEVAILFVLYVLFVISEAAGLASVYPLINELAGTKVTTETSGLLGEVSKIGLLIPSLHPIIVISLFIIAVQTVKFFVAQGFETFNAYLTTEIHYRLKRDIFARFAKSSYDYFLQKKAGELIYLANSAPSKPAQIISYLLQATVEALKFFGILFVLFSVNPKVTIFMLIGGLIFAAINGKLSKKVSYVTGSGRVEFSNRATTAIQEFLAGVKQIKVFNVTKRWENEFNAANRGFCDLAYKDTIWLSTSNRLFEFIGITGACLILIALVQWRGAEIQNNLALFSVYLFALLRIVPTVKTFGTLRMQIAALFADTEKVYGLLNTPETAPTRDGEALLKEFKSEIRLQKVTFNYKNREPVLSNFELEIKKGQVTALVGSSGAGKTTILNLIFGLYQPESGDVLLDGKSLREIRLESWLDKVGYVSQDNFVFHGTIEENIIFGRKELTREHVIKAAKLANADTFIEQLPQKYSTVVGERGMKLSGGQQQRIAIARALANNPEFVVFDEATSALDNVNEKIIQETIKSISKSRTILIIAHRITTVVDADVIYVLGNGKVLEKGTYKDLLSKGGEFSRLYASSTSTT